MAVNSPRLGALRSGSPRLRDGFLIVLLVVAGGALIAAVVTRTLPASWWPPPTGRPDYLYNLRLFKMLLVLEGCGLAGLGVLLAWRGRVLRRLGGIAILERHPFRVAAVLGLVHLAATAFWLPPMQVLSDEPVHTADHARQYYELYAASALQQASGAPRGYDPFFAAGYPAGLAPRPDTRALRRFVGWVDFLGLPAATKAWILLVHLGIPAWIYLAARLCGTSRAAALLAAFLATLYWHAGRPFVGSLRWNGMHAYLLASAVGVAVVATFTRVFDRDHRRRAAAVAGLTGLVALAGALHPMALAIPVPALALLWLQGLRDLRRRDHLALGLAAIVLGLLLTPDALRWIRWRALLPPPSPGLQLQGIDLLRLLLRPSSAAVFLAIALAPFALREWMRQRPLGGAALLVTAVWTAALAGSGASIPGLRRFEAGRFLVPATLAVCVLAGPAALTGLRRLQRATSIQTGLVALCVLATVPVFAAILDARFFYAHRLDATLHPSFLRLMHTIDRITPRDSRLLFEGTRPGWISGAREDAALLAWVPLYTHREVIGGPLLDDPLIHAHVDFGSGQLLGRPLGAWDTPQFEAFLRRYNIGAAVAWSAAGRRFLARHAAVFDAVSEEGNVRVHRVREPASAVTGGRAVVRADYNRIQLEDVEGDSLVLKYHWVQGLEASPPVRLERVRIPGDPVGFIGVRPGRVRRLQLRCDPRRMEQPLRLQGRP